jgi:hypothetical protein
MTIKKSIKTVSIITITQFKRFDCLKVLFEMIKKQTYKNIKEWIIVEGSQSKEDALQNKLLIKDFINNVKNSTNDNIKELINYNINYIEYSGLKLGGLRNLGNSSCTCDIIVCLDDDDYYPPDRITEAVEKLSNSNCLISGVSDVYLYDFFINKLYKFKGFMEYHSTNNCMAYKKEYLIHNKHDPEIKVGEERSFTKEFTIPLVKLDSRKTIIAISHNFNTFNKRELCLGGTLKTLNTLNEIDEPITNYIDPEIYNMMKKIYYKECDSEYDLVYLLGCYSRKFHPNDKDLEHSEINIIKFAEYSVKVKKQKVAIYGDFNLEEDMIVNNVHYIHWKKFPYHYKFKKLILWRAFGILNGLPFELKADKIIWDCHDNPVGNEKLIELWNKYKNKIDLVLFKSKFHMIEVQKYLGTIKKFNIIPSGVRIKEFTDNWDNVSRNPYRFCYNTSYDRGLEFIINGIFLTIKKIEPRTELHVYGGMDMINDTNFRNKMIKAFSNEGVTDHGKQSHAIISREKHLSAFHIYIANIVNEVDAIDLKESIIAGCIPLTVNYGVFLETEGIRFDMNHEDSRIMQRIALEILKVMRDTEKVNEIRNNFKKSTTIESCDIVCEKLSNILFS